MEFANTSQSLRASQYAGSINRLPLSPDLIRRIATLAGYDAITVDEKGKSSEGKMQQVPALSDLVNLILTVQLANLEPSPTNDTKKDAEVAQEILKAIFSGAARTLPQVHAMLPKENIVLLDMGHPRLVGSVVEHRLFPGARELATHLSESDLHECTPGTRKEREQEWLGRYILDASNLGALQVPPKHTPEQKTPNQVSPEEPHTSDGETLRVGMSLADSVAQVWGSARGWWSLKPTTRYIVPSRLGWCPYVFRIPENAWREDSFAGSKRMIATTGIWIDTQHDQLYEMGAPDPHKALLPTMKLLTTPPTEDDRAVAKAVAQKVLLLGAKRKNPVIRLREKGRNLYKN